MPTAKFVGFLATNFSIYYTICPPVKINIRNNSIIDRRKVLGAIVFGFTARIKVRIQSKFWTGINISECISLRIVGNNCLIGSIGFVRDFDGCLDFLYDFASTAIYGAIVLSLSSFFRCCCRI